jgi:hypothetical protein
MKYEYLHDNEDGVKIYARIDDDGKCRVTCTEDNPDYQAYLKRDEPQVEHLTEIIPTDEAQAL